MQPILQAVQKKKRLTEYVLLCHGNYCGILTTYCIFRAIGRTFDFLMLAVPFSCLRVHIIGTIKQRRSTKMVSHNALQSLHTTTLVGAKQFNSTPNMSVRRNFFSKFFQGNVDILLVLAGCILLVLVSLVEARLAGVFIKYSRRPLYQKKSWLQCLICCTSCYQRWADCHILRPKSRPEFSKLIASPTIVQSFLKCEVQVQMTSKKLRSKSFLTTCRISIH